MAQVLTDAEVRRVAALARLELTPDEVALFAKQLADILAYANAVQQVDTTGVEPTSHPHAIDSDWRDDTAVPSLSRNDVLEQAPAGSKASGLFKVPKVL